MDTHRANPFGLCNVHGNVYEFCSNVGYLYGSETDYDKIALGFRPVRGGAYNHPPGFAACARRNGVALNSKVAWVGLRPARAIEL